MHHTPSRKEKRESKFYLLAEQGKFETETSLFICEERNLKKSGFEVVRNGDNKKESLPSKVSWENPFKNGIPLIVSNYINGIIQTFPEASIKNWAQELYVIAARANHDKGTNN